LTVARHRPPRHQRDHHDPVNQDRAPSLSGSHAARSVCG
jgi:hypothetical protein